MLEILLLHIIVVALAILFADLGTRVNRNDSVNFRLNICYIISFSILLVFLGFRESLGRDLTSYERIFSSNNQQEFILGESREIGFLLLIQILRFFNLDFHSFIFVTSLLMLSLLYASYRKFYFLLPFGIFIFFTDWGYTVTINTIRQGIALMALLNASLYIDSNEKRAGIKYLFFIFVGFLFHYTILAFLPLYYIGRLKLKPVYFYCLCVTVFILSFFLVLPLVENTISLVDKYERYLDDPSRWDEEHTFGLGATLVLLIRIAPVFIYKYVKSNYPILLKFFVFYFLGLSIYYGFYYLLIVTRFTFYLQFFELFVISYFLFYLFRIKKHFIYRIFGIGYAFLIIFVYIFKFEVFLVDQLTSPRFSLMFIDFYFKN